MFRLQKSTKKYSSRKQIKIKEVHDDVLILPGNKYRMILETSSVNFELKSEEEQDVIIDSFQNFLNSLATPIQILIRIREIDVDSYLARITKSSEKETEVVYKKQMEAYASFIQNLIAGNKILSRRFYVVIPYDAHDTHDFTLIKEQLLLHRDIVSRGLEKLGMKAKTLSSLELLELFYSFYNPHLAKTQPMTHQTLRVLERGSL